jgi:hypothetical protein
MESRTKQQPSTTRTNFMKTQQKNGRGLYLQKRNNRWKWMVGATAATAAGVTASQGGLVTINLVNNYISGWGGNHLNADLTGDGHPDLTIANAGYYRHTRTLGTTGYGNPYRVYTLFASARLNGVTATGFWSGDYAHGFARIGSKTASYLHLSYPSLIGTIPIFFKDLHINDGAPTIGSLEVAAGRSGVSLDSFTYTSNTPSSSISSTVPEQGSSLALLAIGAGGVLALRRLRAAQKRS